jgi:pyridoxamine-phosphate oxidase
MPNNFLKHFRREYLAGKIDENELLEDPHHQFMEWLEDATRSGIDDPNAMALATVDTSGRPSLRTVLLKDARQDGYVFVTHYNSRKARDLAANRYAALAFFWPGLERQVRVEGITERLPSAESDELFNARPTESRIAAIISPQSEILENRDQLEEKFGQYRKLFNEQNLKRPEYWGGYILKPDYYEFWQGRENRLNDRICYRPDGNIWSKQRLAP